MKTTKHPFVSQTATNLREKGKAAGQVAGINLLINHDPSGNVRGSSLTHICSPYRLLQT